MGFLFESYLQDRPIDRVLIGFRNGIVNSFRFDFKTVLDYKELYESNEKDIKHLRKLIYKNIRVNRNYVINLFNEIGFNLDELKLQEEFIEGLEIYDYYYEIEDLWNLINSTSNDVFYGIMLYISQTSTTNELLIKLQQTVKEELLRNRIALVELRKTVFIAMGFSDELISARETIMRAIEDKGYKAIIIDEKEHNEQIVPQIYDEIYKAEFTIADLTLHRNGVYYEAGYAKGLGKEVIFTCREDDFENSHFDVKQINTIKWKNVGELEKKLSKRIESMMTRQIEEQHVPF